MKKKKVSELVSDKFEARNQQKKLNQLTSSQCLSLLNKRFLNSPHAVLMHFKQIDELSKLDEK